MDFPPFEPNLLPASRYVLAMPDTGGSCIPLPTHFCLAFCRNALGRVARANQCEGGDRELWGMW